MVVGEGSGGAKLMAVWVYRDGHLVEKHRTRKGPVNRSDFPTPRISRIEPYASPIDGKEITSWAARDKDLRDSNSYDPRDGKVASDGPRERARLNPEQLSLFSDLD